MLAGLLVLLLAGPALRTFVPPSWAAAVVWITVGIAMATGSVSLVSSRAAAAGGIVAGVGFGACGVAGSITGAAALHVITATGFLAFCAWGIGISLRQVLVGPVVDLNRIAGAVCVYLLMGLLWANAYVLLALAVDGAFAGLEPGGADALWPRLTYFSFVTLTTLGYGDVTPRIPLAGSLAYLEAVIGQLYVAILIGGLVGAHLSSRGR